MACGAGGMPSSRFTSFSFIPGTYYADGKRKSGGSHDPPLWSEWAGLVFLLAVLGRQVLGVCNRGQEVLGRGRRGDRARQEGARRQRAAIHFANGFVILRHLGSIQGDAGKSA